MRKHKEYREKPADTFYEFLTDPWYLNTDETFKKIIDIGEELATEKYREGIVVAGIGAGKSYLSEVVSLWYAHKVLCLKDPYKHFGLSNDKPIAIINMGSNARQAKNTVFTGIKNFIKSSPFFNKFISPENILETEIKSDDKRMLFICGNSKETTPLGLNIYVAVLDEAAWYLDNEQKSIAEEIYFALQRRIVSRFGTKGLIMIISSVRYENDFIMRKFNEGKDKKSIYSLQAKTWELKDRSTMKPDTFDFIVSRDSVTGEPTETWKGIPVDFKDAFDTNPEKAMRDFGAKPSKTLEGYFKNIQALDTMFSNRPTPIDDSNRFKPDFKASDNDPRFIHVDLGLNRDGGDACGFAMGKLIGYSNNSNEEKPKLYYDIVLQIKAKPKDEIKFESVREMIYQLKDLGFRIELVTYDGWQSVESIQQLNAKGIKAETLSMDKTTEAYDALKSAIYDKRIDIYKHDILLKELKGLELVKGKKVDHAPGGSKDVADAVAGVAYHITKRYTPDKKYGSGFGTIFA